MISQNAPLHFVIKTGPHLNLQNHQNFMHRARNSILPSLPLRNNTKSLLMISTHYLHCFFSKFLVEPQIIFSKFRGTPNPKVKKCKLLFMKEASLSNPYPKHHNPNSHQKVRVWGWVRKKKVIFFGSNQRI